MGGGGWEGATPVSWEAEAQLIVLVSSEDL